MERFKTIACNPEYEIGEFGTVISKRTGKKLKVFSRHKVKDYLAVALGRTRETQKIYAIHRLLALAFIPNPEGNPIINHKDGVKANNTLRNLEWTTHSKNLKHAVDLGLNVAKVGIGSHASKLTEVQVRKIREMCKKGGRSEREIGEIFGVTRSCIQAIKNNITWKHLI